MAIGRFPREPHKDRADALDQQAAIIEASMTAQRAVLDALEAVAAALRNQAQHERAMALLAEKATTPPPAPSAAELASILAGLGPVQRRVLLVDALDTPDGLNAAGIGTQATTNELNVYESIRGMENKGILERLPPPPGAKGRRWRPTPVGRAVAELYRQQLSA